MVFKALLRRQDSQNTTRKTYDYPTERKTQENYMNDTKVKKKLNEKDRQEYFSKVGPHVRNSPKSLWSRSFHMNFKGI
jgi:hypothetical protein